MFLDYRCLFTSVLIFGCTPDSQLIPKNQAPEVHIVSDSWGTLREGAELILGAEVSDADNSAKDLTVDWFNNEQLICENTPIDAYGYSECVHTLEAGEQSFRVLATDLHDRAEDEVRVHVNPNHAPTGEIIAPGAETPLYADEPIIFSALVTDLDDPSAELIVRWRSNMDGDLFGLQNQPEVDGTVTDMDFLGAGAHILTLEVIDPLGKTSESHQTVHVKPTNTAPTCRILTPEDDDPSVAESPLLFEAFAQDVDIAATELTAYWHSDRDGELGVVHPTVDGQVLLPHDGLSIGHHILQLIVEDERGVSCIDYVSHIAGGHPTITLTSPKATRVYNVGDAVPIRATVSDVLDNPYEIDLKWEKNSGSFAGRWADGGGQVSFEHDGFSGGMETLTVTATNEIGMTSTDSVVFRMNRPPTAPSIQIMPNMPTTHSDLSVNMNLASTDPDGDTITYSYEWQKDGITAGVTSDRILSSATKKGETWTVSITPNDGYMDGPAAVASVVIQNTAPSLSTAVISPTPAYANDTLTCTGVGFVDADGDLDQSKTQWTHNGTIIGSSATLSATAYTRGDTLVCTITPYDGESDGPAVAHSITLSNTVPGAPMVGIDPAQPQAQFDDLVCKINSESNDPDGDPITYQIDWTVNGSRYTGTTYTTVRTGDTIDAADVGKNDIWTCTITPHDGITHGPASSGSATSICTSGISTDCPAISCKDILDDGLSTGDGLYWLDPDGYGSNLYECDMKTDGGGWTNVVDWDRSAGDTWTDFNDALDVRVNTMSYATSTSSYILWGNHYYYSRYYYGYYGYYGSGDAIYSDIDISIPNSGEYRFNSHFYAYYWRYSGLWFSVETRHGQENAYCQDTYAASSGSYTATTKALIPTSCPNNTSYLTSSHKYAAVDKTATDEVIGFQMLSLHSSYYYSYSYYYRNRTYMYYLDLWVR